MPSTRIYSIRGKAKGSLTGHQTKIQLSTYSPSTQYRIVKFKVWTSNTSAGVQLNGTITKGRVDGLNPAQPDFGDQNEIAWSSYASEQGVGVGSTVNSVSCIDNTLFNYDVWLHTAETTAGALSAQDVNYYIEIEKFKTSKEAGAISSLRQYAVSPLQE